MASEIWIALENNWEGLEHYARTGQHSTTVCKPKSVDSVQDFWLGYFSELMQFLEFLEVIHDSAEPDFKKYVEDVFFKAFNSDFLSRGKNRKNPTYGEGIIELPIKEEDFKWQGSWYGTASLISPSTVFEMHQLSLTINLEDYRELFGLVKGTRKRGWDKYNLQKFEAFMKYAQIWLDSLKAASDVNAGITIYYAGNI